MSRLYQCFSLAHLRFLHILFLRQTYISRKVKALKYNFVSFAHLVLLLCRNQEKKCILQKLMEQQSIQEYPQDPFLNIFEDGMEEFVRYQREKGENYKTKHQRHVEKHERLDKIFNDPNHKKERNRQRRKMQKERLLKVTTPMTAEERKIFKKEREKRIKEQRSKVKEAMTSGQVMMLDLVFEDKMNSKENKSLCKQVQLIMKCIRHIDEPPSIHLCSYGGQAQTQFQKMGIQHWFVSIHLENVFETAQKMNKKVVYLSPDAQLPLENVQKDTAYVLGGLIDRSIIKNASLNRSKQLGVQARCLPIKPFMKNRQVLNLDHVIMMVLKFRDTNDWKTAFDYAAPKRWKKDEEGQGQNSQDEPEKTQNKYQNELSSEKIQNS